MAKLGNLTSRLVVAVIGVPILLLAILQDRPELLFGLVFAASLIAMYEFFAMTLDDKRDRAASLIIGAAACSALYWIPPERSGELAAVMIAVVPVALYYLFRFGDLTTVAGRLTASVTGIVYAGLMFTTLALIKRDFGPEGGEVVILVLLVGWLADTGAYFAGRFLGKKKLYPAISPGKTWAGAIGGLTASLGSAVAAKLTFLPDLYWFDVPIIGLCGGALGQLGDLAESMIKRSRGVKDSGAILPGHGGILDRVDAILFIGPFVYLYLLITG